MTQRPSPTHEHTPDTAMVTGPRCDKIISGDGVMSYHCTLALGHQQQTLDPEDPQPCYAMESRRARRSWSGWKDRENDREQIRQAMLLDSVMDCPECGQHSMRVNWKTMTAHCPQCGADADLPDPAEGTESSEPLPDLMIPHNLRDPYCSARSENNQTGLHLDENAICTICRPWRPSDGVPSKQRPGDQRLSNKGHMVVQDWIIEAMQESKRVGKERYGQPLMTFDGRLNIKDLADELRDAFVYVSKLQMTAEADKEVLVQTVTEAFRPMMADLRPDADADSLATGFAEAAVEVVLDWVLAQRIGPEQVRP